MALTALGIRQVQLRRKRLLTSLAIVGIALGCDRAVAAELEQRANCNPTRPSPTTAEVFKALADRARELGLPVMNDPAWPDDVREIRIWRARWPRVTTEMVRVRRDADSVSGQLYFIGDWEGQCAETFVLPSKRSACLAMLEGVSWPTVLSRLERARVWSLRDESQLSRRVRVMDGYSVRVEVRSKDCYRTYAYRQPDVGRGVEYRRAAAIAKVASEVAGAWAGTTW